MLRFYKDCPGLAWDTDLQKWIRVDESKSPIMAEDRQMADAVKLEADIALYDGPDQVEHFFDHWTRKTEQSATAKRFISGFETFDQKLGGIETGEVVVISGKKKNGKTLFAESWIRAMLFRDEKIKAMYLSYEVQTEKLLVKYLDNPKFNIYVPRILKTMDFEWFKEKCLEAKIKHGVNLVLIDHLHFMIDMALKQNFSLNIGAFMRRLKQEIAIGMDMAVILIAHQGQLKDDQAASSNSLRDSSFIAQESDATIIVSRKKNFDEADMNKLEQKQPSKYQRYCDRVMTRNEQGIEAEDIYSMGLALVTIDCARRTGTYEFKKVFQKVGEFMEEL